ncbi:MAG: hypothetical protein E6Q67_05145 [Roseateles sp.]|nr:MAG: hypothetical protein E6Q67_05145 [Roseateles sp.]
MTWRRVFHEGRWQARFVPAPPPLPPFLFDQQRGTCESCAHHRAEISSSLGIELHCGLYGCRQMSCSYSRLPEGPCGPSASQFKPTLNGGTHGRL